AEAGSKKQIQLLRHGRSGDAIATPLRRKSARPTSCAGDGNAVGQSKFLRRSAAIVIAAERGAMQGEPGTDEKGGPADLMEACALSPAKSRDLIARIEKDI
ncbi:hypothetical protein ACFXPX_34635, partial [Kitasatospora sp. NPDC059146]|uniref:hypothetical protein n=1 Tax=Kitasatospora sp. NPDC059146 TaxID=3346741 RepID=UPI0036BE20A3